MDSFGGAVNMPNMMKDLRNIVKNIANGFVSISIHPVPKNNGNIWAIRGPEKNLVVMLYYVNKFGLSSEEYTADAIPIEQQPDEKLTVESPLKEPELPIKFIVDICAPVTDEIECILPDMGNSAGPPTEASNLQSTGFKDEHVDSVFDEFGTIYENDIGDVNFQDCEPIKKLQVIPTENSSHHGVTSIGQTVSQCDNLNDNLIQWKDKAQEISKPLVLENYQVNLPSDIPICDTDSINSKEMQHHEIVIKQEMIDTDASVSGDDFIDISNLATVVMESTDFSPVINEEVDQHDQNHQQSCDKLYRSTRSKQQSRISGPENNFECIQCGKKYCDKATLRRHIRIHSGEKPHECSECGKKFSQMATLKQHQKIHSGVKPFECLQCGKKFAQKFALIQHLIVHSGETPFECVQCGKKFSHFSTLSRHKQVHVEEKRFECSECGKKFKLKASFTQHQFLHSGEFPFECSECGKKFNDKSSLRRHKMTHSGEKPFQCNHCGKKFSQRTTLNQHTLLHTGVKPFECLQCGKKFTQRSGLNQHSSSVHNGEKS